MINEYLVLYATDSGTIEDSLSKHKVHNTTDSIAESIIRAYTKDIERFPLRQH